MQVATRQSLLAPNMRDPPVGGGYGSSWSTRRSPAPIDAAKRLGVWGFVVSRASQLAWPVSRPLGGQLHLSDSCLLRDRRLPICCGDQVADVIA